VWVAVGVAIAIAIAVPVPVAVAVAVAVPAPVVVAVAVAVFRRWEREELEAVGDVTIAGALRCSGGVVGGVGRREAGSGVSSWAEERLGETGGVG
jgi:hypothetical protein